MGAARLSLRAGGRFPCPAVFGQGSENGDGARGGAGQAAAGRQMLTWAIAVRVVMARPAPGKAWRVLGKRRDKPAWRRRWKSSTSKG
jgi:hypothetical protein